MKIFVQIASYRDPQLIPTIKDMLVNAKKPKNKEDTQKMIPRIWNRPVRPVFPASFALYAFLEKAVCSQFW